MHMAGLDRRLLPGLAERVGRPRDDQHRLHAERARHQQVLLDILEHRGAAGIDARAWRGNAHRSRARAWAGSRPRRCRRCPRNGAGCRACPRHSRHGRREPLVRISLRPGRAAIASPSFGSGSSRLRSIWWAKSRKIVGIDVMLLHQPLQRRAVALVIVFLQRARGHAVETEQLGQEQRDPLVDLRPDLRLMRIQRVVEVEDPVVDMGERLPLQGRQGCGGESVGVHDRDAPVRPANVGRRY